VLASSNWFSAVSVAARFDVGGMNFGSSRIDSRSGAIA
jgi:hypothetical protein